MIKTAQKPPMISRYLTGHKRACSEGLSMPWKHPVKSLMTILTLAICFYIPLLLWTLWLNYDEIKDNWQNQGSIAVFINQGNDKKATDEILQQLQQSEIVISATLKKAEDIKSQLAGDEQLSQIIDFISDQDLPTQISVNIDAQSSTEQLDQLLTSMDQQPSVEYVSYDRQWLNQLQAMTQTLLHMAQVSAIIFILIIMVILANIITNELTDHKNELRLLELIGASWAQVRRSFLYMGTLLGVYSAILAVLFISISFWWLKDTINTLVEQFGINIQLHGLNPQQILMVIGVCLLVTWLATRLSLSKTVLAQLSDH